MDGARGYFHAVEEGSVGVLLYALNGPWVGINSAGFSLSRTYLTAHF